MSEQNNIDENAGTISEAGMRQIASELSHWAAHFAAIAEAMKHKKVPQLTDQNAKTLLLAIKYVRNGAKQARFGFDAAQIPGGGVSMPSEPGDTPKKGRKKGLSRGES